jgi:hypothetical protein
MKHRWKDRIQILLNRPISYDAWGHALAHSTEQITEIWTNIITIMGTTSTARVTVKAPFDKVLNDATEQLEYYTAHKTKTFEAFAADFLMTQLEIGLHSVFNDPNEYLEKKYIV